MDIKGQNPKAQPSFFVGMIFFKTEFDFFKIMFSAKNEIHPVNRSNEFVFPFKQFWFILEFYL